MVHRGGDKNPYHLLDGVISLDDEGQLFDRLLGLVTDNLARPLNGCRPEAPFKARDHIEQPRRLYPLQAVECKDVAWLEANTVERDAKAEFAKIFKLWGDYRRNNTDSWNSTLMRRIEIQENPRERIKELLKVRDYEQGVRNLMLSQEDTGPKRTLGIITGFITCTDMAVNKDDERATGAGAAAQPVSGKITGIPGTNLATEGSFKKTRHKAISGAYKGEVVVACSYLPIVGYFDEQKGSWFRDLIPWQKATASRPGRLQVGAEPMMVHVEGSPATYKIGEKSFKGNMNRPLGSGGEASADEEKARLDELLEYLEGPADLQFTIGQATSMELIVWENSFDE